MEKAEILPDVSRDGPPWTRRCQFATYVAPTAKFISLRYEADRLPATRRQIFLYSLLLMPIGMSPWLFGYAGALFGAVSTLERRFGTALNPWNRGILKFDADELRSDPRLRDALREGEAMSAEEAVEYGLGG